MNSKPLPAIRGQNAAIALGRAGALNSPTFPEDQAGPDWRRITSALLRFKGVSVCQQARNPRTKMIVLDVFAVRPGAHRESRRNLEPLTHEGSQTHGFTTHMRSVLARWR